MRWRISGCPIAIVCSRYSGDAALALLEVGRPAHGADAHRAVLERDHPEPAVLEPVHADVPLVLALSAGRRC